MVRLHVLGPLGLTAADGTELRAILAQPKRLALLAYLAVASPGGFRRRDTLLALFWPESPEPQARLALRQALHHLRSAVGPSVIANRGDAEVGLVANALWCDAVAFRQALSAGEGEEALALYRGDLLEGFSISGISTELERWLETERATLKERAAREAAALCDRATTAGDLALATRWARRALELSADDEGVLRQLVRLLDRQGDRASALRVADTFARRTMDELGAEPAAETKALLAEVRARAAVHAVAEPRPPEPSPPEGPEPPGPAVVAMASAPRAIEGTDDGGAMPGVVRRARRGTSRRVTLALALLGAGALAVPFHRLSRAVSPVLVVGWIDNGRGAAEEVRVLPVLLETELARRPGHRTMSTVHLHEVLDELGTSEEPRAGLARAARAAGATELLEGALYRRTLDTLRLDLHRVELRTGVVLRAYTIEASDLFTLADAAATSVAADLDLAAAEGDVAREAKAGFRVQASGFRGGMERGPRRDPPPHAPPPR